MRKKELVDAIETADISRFREHFEASDLFCNKYFGDSLLNHAAVFGPLEIIKFLVENGADLNMRGGGPRAAAVTHAAYEGKLDVTRYLVEAGATIDISNPSTNPLLKSAQEGHLEVVKYLLSIGVDPHACYLLPTGAMINALSEAENARRKDVAELLKAHGCRRPIKGVDVPIWQPPPERMLNQTPEYQRYQKIIAYMEGRFGPADQNGQQELLPPIEGMSIAINFIQPNEEHPFLVLFTNGMSDLPMKVPPGQEQWQYAELVMQLPPDWVHPRDANGDPRWTWPIQLMREMAYHPHQNQTWYGPPYAIVSNGEPPEPLGPNLKQNCMLLIPDFSNLKPPLERADGTRVHFFTMVPLFAEERDFELKNGNRAFLKRIVERGVPMTADLERPNFGG